MHSNLMAHAMPLAATKNSGGGGSWSILILIGIFVVAYLVLIRPARNRQRAAAATRGKCEVGDEVTTTSGLIATVVAVDEDAITLEVAPGVRSRYIPAAIMKVNQPEPPPQPDGPIEHEAIESQDTDPHESPDERPSS